MSERSDKLADYAAQEDEELIARLRHDGDPLAYEMLWRRHIGIALAMARRMAPLNAEDLASEAFHAVHHNIAVADVGPQEAFRPYLFQVMRNIAARWRREGERYIESPDFQEIDDVDGLEHVVRSDDSARLLDAFQALPERWQRVLWLSDVEQVPRATIAAEMGLGLNAVSALRRRATVGLRLAWLAQQVPSALREDRQHIARLLPAVVAGTATRAERSETAAHVKTCADCATIYQDLRDSHGRSPGPVLSMAGFAALGVGSGFAAPLLVPAGTAVAIAGALGAAVAGVAIAGGILVGVVSDSTPDHAVAEVPAEATSAPAAMAPPLPAPLPAMPAESPEVLIDATPPATVIPPSIMFELHRPTPEQSPIPKPPRAAPPAAAPGSTLMPGTISLSPAPDPPTVDAAAPAGTYRAPVLRGTAAVGTTVAVELDGEVFPVVVSAEGGWQYDLGAHYPAPGMHALRVWTFTADAASDAEELSFEITPLGIEGIEPETELFIQDAASGFLVMTLTGPPGGVVCLAHDLPEPEENEQGYWITVFEVPLDEAGNAVRSLSFLGLGDYTFDIFLCNEGPEGFSGPETSFFVRVTEPPFGGWGPSLPYRYILIEE